MENPPNKNTLIINLLGGPGASKSTTSAGLFNKLKIDNIEVELITEVAKTFTWQKNWSALSNQFYVTANQHHAQHVLMGQVDTIITDSPIILGLFYYNESNPIIRQAFATFVLETFKQQRNLNIFINRKKKYNPNGRNQTEEEAKEIDKKIKQFLYDNNIDFLEVDGTPDVVETLYPIVKAHL